VPMDADDVAGVDPTAADEVAGVLVDTDDVAGVIDDMQNGSTTGDPNTAIDESKVVDDESLPNGPAIDPKRSTEIIFPQPFLVLESMTKSRPDSIQTPTTPISEVRRSTKVNFQAT
jgi:hypothetical protein